MKICNACGENKPYSEFNKNKEVHDGYRYTCKECRRLGKKSDPKFAKITRKKQDKSIRIPYGTKARTTEATERVQINRLAKYGLTVTQFNVLQDQQQNKCAICSKPLGEKFCIDHCHETGKVRGLLCYGCNSGIGLLNDDPALLTIAIEYLRQ